MYSARKIKDTSFNVLRTDQIDTRTDTGLESIQNYE